MERGHDHESIIGKRVRLIRRLYLYGPSGSGPDFETLGIETEFFWIGVKPIGSYMACHKCREIGRYVIPDIVNEFREKALTAEGFVFGSPVHYAALSGNMTSFMDRVFYAEANGNGNKAFYLKPAAAVISARRAGRPSLLTR